MDLPIPTQTYKNGLTNNSRWEGFRPRDGDVIICTPSKSGTTWMQAICAHLIFQKSDFYAPIGMISPWIDSDGTPVDEVIARLEGQSHRRFIKTHTPLDGLPFYENVTYIHVARNPFDVMFSLINHMKNMKKALPGKSDLGDLEATFDRWLNTSVEMWAEKGGLSLGYLLHHTNTFWQYKDLPNVHMFHYARMRADLRGQMDRLVQIMNLDISDDVWPNLIDGVSIKNMRENAATFAPGVEKGAWQDNARFFDQGRQGEGARLSEEQIARYEKAASQIVSPDLKTWIERGEF